MATFNKTTQSYIPMANTLHEVMMLADADGNILTPGASAIVGTTDSGNTVSLAATPEGHLEVAIHSPILPFGSVHTESLHPVFQTDAVYGISNKEVRTTIGHLTGGVSSAEANTANNKFICSTGTTALSFATLQSRRRLRYRPGQGVLARFTAMFPNTAASSILVAGIGTGESGLYFGHNSASFGILYSTKGVREILNLQVTTGSTATNNIEVKLANTTYTVATTNPANTTLTAYQIATGNAYGNTWTAMQRGSNVIFVAASVGPKNTTNQLSQPGAVTPVAGSFTKPLTGVAATDTWIAQTDWNGDKLDGTGPSGVILDPTKGNVYQIGLQYLGFGAATFQVETKSPGNNPDWVTVHTLENPNALTEPYLTQPSFPFTMAAYSAGSTANVSVQCGSFAGFVEGRKLLTGPRFSYQGSGTSSTSSLTPLFTVRNDLINGKSIRANQSVINIVSLSGATKSNSGLTTFYVLRNATLTGGVPNFQSYDEDSCSSWDTSATTCTATNGQIIAMFQVAESGNFQFEFADNEEITLQPGETVTLAVRSLTATATCVGSINTREDQ